MVNLRRYFKDDLSFYCYVTNINKEKFLKILKAAEEESKKPKISFEDALRDMEK